MIKSFEDFVKEWQGHKCEAVDPSSPNQCFDLAVQWCINLGLPKNIFQGNSIATQIWSNPQTFKQALINFEYIENKSDNKPDKGDIVVFGKGINHVVIATGDGDTKKFKAFSQNDPINSPCIINEYDYSHVLGWLRYNPQILVPIIDNEDNVKNATLYKELKPKHDALILEIDEYKKGLDIKNKEVGELKKQVDTLTKKVAELSAIPNIPEPPDAPLASGKKTTLYEFLLELKDKIMEILHKTLIVQKGEVLHE
jgi:hypothetical protein